ncbi:MAG: glycine zipper 2TM domain-containing protein [Burkholderiales bacterium]|nr:MAG: glycine zipper 2TM domain-containing protein [Burkholderiales bacterium]
MHALRHRAVVCRVQFDMRPRWPKRASTGSWIASKGTQVTEATSTSNPLPRNAVIAAGSLALAGVGLAAGLWLGAPRSAPPVEAVAAETPAKPAVTAKSTAKPRSVGSPAATDNGASRTTPLATQPAVAACTNCGIVEGVRPVQRKGEGTGVGAVAGGVIGGALGSRMGAGNGRTAMTVLGAVGGGVAGHEIEKRARSETVYEVQVRMDDGTLRTFTRAEAPAPGARVQIEGQQLRVVASPDAPRTVRVSSQGA